MTPATGARSRRLPPFARVLVERLGDDAGRHQWCGSSSDGTGVTLWVACGADAWRWARPRLERFLLVVAPPGEDPTAFDWRLLAGHDPVLLVRAGAVEGEHVERLLAALMRDGVERVLDLLSGVRYMTEDAHDAA